MAIALQSIHVRTERRIRLTFTNTLTIGAFGVPGPAFYTVESLSGQSVNPTVVAALSVPGSAQSVELALNVDLATGGRYTVKAVGVPAADASTTPVGTEQPFVFGVQAKSNQVPTIVRQREKLLYGCDLTWNGSDFSESATGDLERTEGVANVHKAINRALSTSGLTWDPGWGLNAREYVDSPSSAVLSLRGAIGAQLVRDSRIRTVKIDIEALDEKTYVHIQPTLVSTEPLEPVTIQIDNA